MSSTVTYAQHTQGLGIEVDTANRPTEEFEIYADLRSGRMGLWTMGASSTVQTMDEHHGHVTAWRIPTLSAGDLNELLADITPHVQVLVNAYESEWDGHNNVATTEGPAVEAARNAIDALCDGGRLENRSFEYLIAAAELLGEAIEEAVHELVPELIAAHAATGSNLTITWGGMDDDLVITHPIHGLASESLNGLVTSSQEGDDGDIQWIRKAFAQAVMSAVDEFEQADEEAADEA